MQDLQPIYSKGNSDREWLKVRSKFILKSNVAYMNNASLGMPPRLVVNAVSNGYKSISEEPLLEKRELQKNKMKTFQRLQECLMFIKMILY